MINWILHRFRRRPGAAPLPPLSDRPPVIAFLGLFGVGNFGNEASLRAAREAVAGLAPEARLVCVCAMPDRVAAEHCISAYSLRMAGPLDRIRPRSRPLRLLARPPLELARIVTSIRFLRGVDAVIVPGTGILDDFGERPWQMPYDLFRWSLACRLSGTRLLYLSIGAGPIRNRASRILMKWAAGFADYCSYRDEASKDYMAGIGRDVTNDLVFPDLAFSLPRPPLQVRESREGPLIVGVGVMAYHGWTGRGAGGARIHEAYLAGLLEFCGQLLEAGHSVILLIGEDYDASAVNRLREMLDRQGGDYADRVSAPPLRSMDDVLRAIAATDLVVATRFHNVVAALMMQRPVLSLGYAKKNQDLLGLVGLAGYSSHVEGFDPAEIGRQFRELASRTDVREPLARANAEFAAALACQYQDILGRAAVTLATRDVPPRHPATRESEAGA